MSSTRPSRTKAPSSCRFDEWIFTRTAPRGSGSTSFPSIREPGGDGTDERRAIASSASVRTVASPPFDHSMRAPLIQSPFRPRPIAAFASRSAVFFAMSWRLSWTFFPFATPSSTFTRPCLK